MATVTLTSTTPLVIPISKDSPSLTYVERAAPPIFKMSNGLGFAISAFLFATGWEKTAGALVGLNVLDMVLRSTSSAYAKTTAQFYGHRR